MALAQNVQKPLEIQHIAGNSYNYITYGDGGGGNIYPTNSVYVVTKKGVVLIDGPWDPSQVEPLLDSIAKKHKQKVVLAITTHFHDDKTASLDMFKAKGIPTYAAQKTDEIALLRNEKRAQYHFSKDTVLNIQGCKRKLINNKMFKRLIRPQIIKRYCHTHSKTVINENKKSK